MANPHAHTERIATPPSMAIPSRKSHRRPHFDTWCACRLPHCHPRRILQAATSRSAHPAKTASTDRNGAPARRDERPQAHPHLCRRCPPCKYAYFSSNCDWLSAPLRPKPSRFAPSPSDSHSLHTLPYAVEDPARRNQTPTLRGAHCDSNPTRGNRLSRRPAPPQAPIPLFPKREAPPALRHPESDRTPQKSPAGKAPPPKPSPTFFSSPSSPLFHMKKYFRA